MFRRTVQPQPDGGRFDIENRLQSMRALDGEEAGNNPLLFKRGSLFFEAQHNLEFAKNKTFRIGRRGIKCARWLVSALSLFLGRQFLS